MSPAVSKAPVSLGLEIVMRVLLTQPSGPEQNISPYLENEDALFGLSGLVYWPNRGIVWFMLSRRMIFLAPLAEPVIAAAAAANRMMLCLHQNTSSGAGFRKSLEG